jgi:NAD(P)-dependent dehydrogenase (short-subunit alcohol dehydrogenase family)
MVTGGANGIGLGIARRLAEAGANIVIGDLDTAAAERAADVIQSSFGTRSAGIHLDVRDGASAAEFVQAAVQLLGGIDIWVNNAGIYPTVPLLQMTDSNWDEVITVNLRGTFVSSREAARVMVAQGTGGVILNLASSAAYRAAGPGNAHYVAAKHGVRGLTKSLAVELGPHGIRVLAVAPTLVATPGTHAARAGWLAAGLGDALARQASGIPLGRSSVVDDVARVALFCVSDLSMMMSGTCLLVDGGDLIH